MDDTTAAGAEAMAGALQEYGRALLIGSQTAGNSSVHMFFTHPGGTAIKLLTAKWFTAKNVSVEGKGLTPDIVVAAPPLGLGTIPGDLQRDLQLQRAIEVIKQQ